VSFAPWIGGTPPAQGRDDFLIEHWRSVRDDRLDYVEQVADGDQVRLLHGDQRARPRASVLFEFDDGGGVASGAVAVPLGADADATFANLATAIPTAVPFTTVSHLPAFNRLTALDGSAELFGVYWIVERNQAQAIVHDYVVSDYYGVRDVRDDLTYVEHESGEVELYDLTIDPHQLENKAGDPAYASSRQRLADRLDQLLR
jgi:hypothetical protein